MIIIGITGTIASGKSTLVKILTREKHKVFESDKYASKILSDQNVLEDIKNEFRRTSCLILKDGSINKPLLRNLVFGSKENLRKLEKITHPAIKKKEKEFVRRCAINRKSKVFLDIPLLLESDYHKRCDFIINLFVNKTIQKYRALARGNMTEKTFNFLYEKQIKGNNKLLKIFHINLNSGNGMFHVKKNLAIFLKRIKMIKKKNVWPSIYCKYL
ncbi:MAG: dephospho-CoA kinase [Rickettsiales bacterium]|nr:dephospho-CoA kinase [Rickettsiales bacterium]|tara:strand:- start:2018 stop:2662 length:645 start_codon:yes stop_codon:yes gene_type:complete